MSRALRKQEWKELLQAGDEQAISQALAGAGKVLDLMDNQIGDEGAAALGTGLAQNSTLQQLYLTSNQIGDEGASALGTGLAQNSTLQQLYLNFNQIGDEGAAALGTGLAQNSTLQWLDLRSNQIGAEGAAALGTLLAQNSTLQQLVLSSNKIGDEGAAALGTGLAQNSTLQKLELNGNQIGDEGAAALGMGLAQNSSCWCLSGVDHPDLQAKIEQNKAQAESFLSAARDADTETMAELLAWGVPVDTWPDEKNTALGIAVEKGDIDLCAWLLERGANPYIRPYGYQPNALDIAHRKGNTAIIDLLVSQMSLSHPPRSPSPPVIDVESHLEIAWSDLRQGELIGEGGFAFVYKGMLRGSTPVAIKMMKVQVMDEAHTAAFHHEVSAMKHLRHRNVLMLHGVCMEQQQVCMVTELCEMGSLNALLHAEVREEPLSEAMKLQIALDVAQGMAYLHGYHQPIMHRDLKPENVLLDERGVAKVSDFGLSRSKEHTKTKTKAGVGTWQYSAPEVLFQGDSGGGGNQGKKKKKKKKRGLKNDSSSSSSSSSLESTSSGSGPSHGSRGSEDAGAQASIDEKVDVYSFAMLLWELVHEERPYEYEETYSLENHVVEWVKDRDMREEIDEDVCPSWAAELIQRCWQTDPAGRPTFEEIVEELRKVKVEEKGQGGGERVHSELVELVHGIHALLVAQGKDGMLLQVSLDEFRQEFRHSQGEVEDEEDGV